MSVRKPTEILEKISVPEGVEIDVSYSPNFALVCKGIDVFSCIWGFKGIDGKMDYDFYQIRDEFGSLGYVLTEEEVVARASRSLKIFLDKSSNL